MIADLLVALAGIIFGAGLMTLALAIPDVAAQVCP